MNEINNNLSKSQMSKNRLQKKVSETVKKFNKEKDNSETYFKLSQFHSDDYNIIKSIGEGTFGKIYLVRNSKSKEIFALKQISLKDKKDLNNNKEEFEFLMKLTEENPDLNIIKILGIEVKRLDKFNVVLYVLMEAGKCDWEKEIHQRNKEKRFYKEEELINILTSLVNTFSILQEKGISHRDVKPQNIVYFTEDRYKNKNIYKITDFGEAKVKKKLNISDMNFEKNTSKQTLRGTELYMSPLLFNGLRTGQIDIKHNTYKSDVYSLGLCFLHAATTNDRTLFEIRRMIEMEKIIKFINMNMKDKYSDKFINIIISMLEIHEQKRPDFVELENILKNYW
jgi:serine/threonine protein kinase